MKEFQVKPEPELKAMLERHGILAKIRSGAVERREKWRKPARMKEGGASIIYSFYEGDTYLCTSHRLVTLTGVVKHCDVKACTIDGVRYKIPDKV